jgi:hypothetical protein
VGIWADQEIDHHTAPNAGREAHLGERFWGIFYSGQRQVGTEPIIARRFGIADFERSNVPANLYGASKKKRK